MTRLPVSPGRAPLLHPHESVTRSPGWAEREFQSIRSRQVYHALTGRTFEFGVTVRP